MREIKTDMRVSYIPGTTGPTGHNAYILRIDDKNK